MTEIKADKHQVLLLSDLFNRDNLNIPYYQRAYAWETRNMEVLLDDLDEAVRRHQSVYRLGSIILHDNNETKKLDIVDGQQRLTSLALLYYYLYQKNIVTLPRLLEKGDFSSPEKFIENSLGLGFASEADANAEKTIQANYQVICAHYATEDLKDIAELLTQKLEVVVLCVGDVGEAFQLFDSQNARGKALYPHHILKAHHLRALGEDEFAIKYAVEKWENQNDAQLSNLFNKYLFPILLWSAREKKRDFSDKDIPFFHGVPSDTTYSYGKRVLKSMPVFQLTQPVAVGNDFFEMVHYYLALSSHIEQIANDFTEKNALSVKAKVRTLFYCALLAYYDRFNELPERAQKKLALWAFAYQTYYNNDNANWINNYALGIANQSKIKIAMFAKIARAQKPSDILNLPMELPQQATNKKDANLLTKLKEFNGQTH